MNETEIDLNQLKKNYSFHDGNLDAVTILQEDIILKLELLQQQSAELESIQLRFKQYSNLIFEGATAFQLEKKSATILKYEFVNSSVQFFLEITNYETDEQLYSNLSFDYASVIQEEG